MSAMPGRKKDIKLIFSVGGGNPLSADSDASYNTVFHTSIFKVAGK